MTNAIKKRLNRKGFTLAEVLVTVAILLILAGVTFVSVVQYQKNLRLMEMDGTAKEIFIAAQNHLSVAKASGDLDRLAEEAKSATGTTDSTIGTKLDPSLVSAYAGDTTSGEYYYVIHNVTSGIESCTPSGSGAILQMMLPFGALDETVATGGNYVIVYELKSASVVAVLYSGAGNASFGNAAVINFGDDDVKAIPTLYNDKSARKSYQKGGVTAIVGCYTGTAGSAAIPTETLEAPKLEVKNENKLHVLVREANNTDNITLVITGEQSGTTARRLLNRNAGAGDGYTSGAFDVTLDDITGDGKYRFSQLIPEGRFTPVVAESNFIPGENIIISAVASSTTAFATPKESAKYTVSSLFDDVNETTNSAGDTKIYIKNLRHLENLGANVSGFTAALGKDTTSGHYNVVNITAVQKNDITMLSFDRLHDGQHIYGSGTFVKTYIAANVDYPLSYDGGSHEIYDLTIAGYHADGAEANAGIFGTVTSALSVKNLVLRNDKIPKTSTSANAGMLLGKTSADLTVDGVLAYYHEETYNADNDSNVEVVATADKSVAGGLIGFVSGGTLKVKNSAAAVYVKGESVAGGLIGSVNGAADGSTIVQSYAGGHTKDGTYDTEVEGSALNNQGAGRYNVQASGYAGGFIGMTTDNVYMDAVYSTASAYSSSGDANSNSFAGSGTPNIQKTADGKKNYYAIGTHNGKDAEGEDIEKAQLAEGQNRRQATAYDRTLMGATETTAHPMMDKTSYPLNTIRHLCAISVDDKDLPWFIKEHVGDWVASKKTDKPHFEVENGNRLTVRINTGLATSTDELKYGIKVHGETSLNDVYFFVSISDTNASVKRTYYYNNQQWPTTDDFNLFNRVSIDGDLGIEFYLDDITQPKGHFYDTCPWLTPGEDISVSVVPEINGNLSSDNIDWRNIDFSKAETQKTNSLFGYLKENDEEDHHNKQKIEAVQHYYREAGSVGVGLVPDGKGKYYVQIDNSRHLENLSPEVSSYPWKGTQSGISIVGGIQTDNIFWSGSSNGNACTAGFQEELGTNLNVYGDNKRLTQDGYFGPIVIDNTALSSYDGSGHTISGLVAHKTTAQTSLALFLQTKYEMTIKNLTIENIDFSITGNESRAAGLIGYADKSVTIDNVYYTGQIKIRGTNCSGGFVGETADQGKLTITNSGTKGSETITTIISDNKAGGLVGYTKIATTVKNVCFTGNLQVQGNDCTGGIIGEVDKDVSITYANVEATTAVKSRDSKAGGLIGYVNGANAKVDNVFYTLKLTVEGESAGGFIGQTEKNGQSVTIKDSMMNSDVITTSESGFAGGVIGLANGSSTTIENIQFNGKLTVSGYNEAGGFIGKESGDVTIKDAGINYASTIISKMNNAGGAIGSASGGKVDVANSKIVGEKSEVIASNNAGGLIGEAANNDYKDFSISNVAASAFVKSYNENSGGLIGKVAISGVNLNISNSYYGGRTKDGRYAAITINDNDDTYTSNIYGKKVAGGFIGKIESAYGLTIKNCFSTGSVENAPEDQTDTVGGFIGVITQWGAGITIKNSYCMGTLTGQNLKNGGFIGANSGGITFDENVFYLNAFNTDINAIGYTAPYAPPIVGSVTSIDKDDVIKGISNSNLSTVSWSYDEYLKSKMYPYKNWTTDGESEEKEKNYTYYGDWPCIPEWRAKGYIAYYEVYADNTLGVYSPGVIDTLTRDMNKVRDGAQKCWYGILINSDSESDAGEYFMDSNNKKFKVSGNIPDYSSLTVPEFSTKIGTDTYYLWNFTGNNDESQLRPTDFPWVRLHDLYNNYVDVNARYGAAIAPIGQLGTESYPFRIRNKIHSGNYYSTSAFSHNYDEYNDHYRDLIFVDDKKGTGPFKNKLS